MLVISSDAKLPSVSVTPDVIFSTNIRILNTKKLARPIICNFYLQEQNREQIGKKYHQYVYNEIICFSYKNQYYIADKHHHW